MQSEGFCAKEKRYRNSLFVCGRFETRPPSMKEQLWERLGFFWEKTGQPTVDAATSSRKTLEMLIIFTFMFIAFIVMAAYIYPAVKRAAIGVYGSSVSGPTDQ